jgi:hypothetical protein
LIHCRPADSRADRASFAAAGNFRKCSQLCRPASSFACRLSAQPPGSAQTIQLRLSAGHCLLCWQLRLPVPAPVYFFTAQLHLPVFTSPALLQLQLRLPASAQISFFIAFTCLPQLRLPFFTALPQVRLSFFTALPKVRLSFSPPCPRSGLHFHRPDSASSNLSLPSLGSSSVTRPSLNHPAPPPKRPSAGSASRGKISASLQKLFPFGCPQGLKPFPRDCVSWKKPKPIFPAGRNNP